MVSLVSESFIVSHRAHDCPGEGCPLCILIQRAEIFFRQLKCAVSCPGFSTVIFLTAVFILKFAAFRFVPPSGVQLKVKMNR
jgi:hypothetical protein